MDANPVKPNKPKPKAVKAPHVHRKGGKKAHVTPRPKTGKHGAKKASDKK